jgi:hypothetical protein
MLLATKIEDEPQGIGQKLFLLASEKSPEKRLELLHHITDAYFENGDRHSSAAEYLFADIITRLLDKISAADRAQASTYLATLHEIPAELAHRLATDQDIKVAAPIVRGYFGLSEHTLITVAKDGSQEHLRSIASRPVVSPPVTDIVVKRGDGTTVRTLAGNLGARFSSYGMRILVDKAEEDAVLQSLLVERPDLSLEAIGKLLPLISRELATRLHGQSIEIDDAAIGAQLAVWLEDRKKNIAKTEAYIAGIRAGHLGLDDVITETTAAHHLFDATTVLAGIIDLEPDHAFRLLAGGKTESVFVLLRSVKLSWRAAERFLVLRSEKMATDEGTEALCHADYESITLAAAQRVVRFMKVRRVAMSPGITTIR